EEAADHRRMRARDDRLRDVPGVADAAVRDDRHVRALERGCDLRDGRDLRHADPRDDPRRADRPRADADLDPVRARLDEGARRLPRHDVAGDELEVRVRALDLADPVQHALRVAVRRVDDHDVDARLDEPRDALLGVVARADGRADAQRAVLVLARVRIVLRLLEVLRGDHPAEPEAVVDDEDLLDPIPVQQRQHLVLARALADGHEPLLRRHHGRDRRVELRLEAQVPVRHDADEVLALDDGHAGDVLGAREVDDLLDGRRGADRYRVGDDPAFELLDPPYLARLLADGHVLVDYADAALLGERDREPRLGHRVHGRGDDRDVQGQRAGELRPEVELARQDLGVSGL